MAATHESRPGTSSLDKSCNGFTLPTNPCTLLAQSSPVAHPILNPPNQDLSRQNKTTKTSCPDQVNRVVLYIQT